VRPEGTDHVTRAELAEFKQFLEEKFRSQSNRFLLYLGVAVGLIRFDIPAPVTAGAIIAMVAKGGVALLFRG